MTNTLPLLNRTGRGSKMKNLMGEVRIGRSLTSPPDTNTLTATPKTVRECVTVCVVGQTCLREPLPQTDNAKEELQENH